MRARRLGLVVLAFVLLVAAVTSVVSATPEPPSTEDGGGATAGSFKTSSKAHDYANVKEDLVCRACVALAGDYFGNVLPLMRSRYGNYVEQGTATRPYRERMIVEVHESVDGLCTALKARHATAHAAEKDTGKVPLSGSTKDLDEALDIACPTTLEAIEEALTEVAFAYLLPDKFPTAKGGDDDEAAATASAETHGQTAYTLPKAGGFCESHKQCLPFVHYHITSIAGGPGGKKESLAKQERETLEKGLADHQAKRRHPDREEDVPGGAADDDDEPSLLETLMAPETYTKLAQRVPLETVTSATFWRWTLHYMFRDSSVRFHLRDRFVFVMGVAIAVFAAFAGLVCLCTRRASPKRDRARPSSAPVTQSSPAPGAAQGHKTSVSGSRRRAPARKEV